MRHARQTKRSDPAPGGQAAGGRAMADLRPAALAQRKPQQAVSGSIGAAAASARVQAAATPRDARSGCATPDGGGLRRRPCERQEPRQNAGGGGRPPAFRRNGTADCHPGRTGRQHGRHQRRRRRRYQPGGYQRPWTGHRHHAPELVHRHEQQRRDRGHDHAQNRRPYAGRSADDGAAACGRGGRRGGSFRGTSDRRASMSARPGAVRSATWCVASALRSVVSPRVSAV